MYMQKKTETNYNKSYRKPTDKNNKKKIYFTPYHTETKMITTPIKNIP